MQLLHAAEMAEVFREFTVLERARVSALKSVVDVILQQQKLSGIEISALNDYVKAKVKRERANICGAEVLVSTSRLPFFYHGFMRADGRGF